MRNSKFCHKQYFPEILSQVTLLIFFTSILTLCQLFFRCLWFHRIKIWHYTNKGCILRQHLRFRLTLMFSKWFYDFFYKQKERLPKNWSQNIKLLLKSQHMLCWGIQQQCSYSCCFISLFNHSIYHHWLVTKSGIKSNVFWVFFSLGHIQTT